MKNEKATDKKIRPLFTLGELVRSQTVADLIPIEDVVVAFACHVQGDWGDILERDRRNNELALKSGEGFFSSYWSSNDIRFLVITTDDRSKTWAMLPEEYRSIWQRSRKGRG